MATLPIIVPIPAFGKIFVDDILIDNLRGWLAPLLIGMAVTAVGRALVTALQQSLLLRLETKLSISMVSRFLRHLLSLPMEFFTQRHAGDVASRVAANEQIARLLSGSCSTSRALRWRCSGFGLGNTGDDLTLGDLIPDGHLDRDEPARRAGNRIDHAAAVAEPEFLRRQPASESGPIRSSSRQRPGRDQPPGRRPSLSAVSRR